MSLTNAWSINMRCFVVGGAVRDVLLGLTPQDFDYVWVGATPQDLVDQGMKQVGVDFPVFLDLEGNEHALARIERKTGMGYYGFECTFDPTVTLHDDQVRRDMTINQLAVDCDQWDQFVASGDPALVHDASSGVEDLHNGVLRHVSPSFSEDPVRILRTARFAARYDFMIAPETLSLMKELVDNNEVDSLVPERVWAETEKALDESSPMSFFWTLRLCGALKRLFGSLDNTLLSVSTPLTLAALTNMPQQIKVGVLFSQSPDAVNTLQALRAPTKNINFVSKLHQLLTFLKHEQAMTASGILQILNNLDAVTRKQVDFFQLIDACRLLTVDQQQLVNVLKGHYAAKHVQFKSLSANQQQTLQGRDIQHAIDQLRLKKIQNVLRSF